MLHAYHSIQRSASITRNCLQEFPDTRTLSIAYANCELHSQTRSTLIIFAELCILVYPISDLAKSFLCGHALLAAPKGGLSMIDWSDGWRLGITYKAAVRYRRRVLQHVWHLASKILFDISEYMMDKWRLSVRLTTRLTAEGLRGVAAKES